MFGFLLARAGIDVVILEKHGDFLRDFRGDSIHPSTLQVMDELGLLDEFLMLPHEKAHVISEQFGDRKLAYLDFRALPTRAKFMAMMPQWDFLNFLAERGSNYASFHLRMRAEAVGLIEEGGRIAGVRATTPQGSMEVRAELTVACDGRYSTVRSCAGLEVDELGAPLDVLWFRLPKTADDPAETTSKFQSGRSLILMDRGDYWQCAFPIPKGSIEETRRAGLPAFRNGIVEVVPAFADRVDALADWEQIKLLIVTVNRLRRWYRAGLLFLGDAAHAMSPVAGVGVNLAIQDAVAAANILWRPLASGTVREDDLKRVQERREFPTRVTQGLQKFLHRGLSRVLRTKKALTVPYWVQLIARVPLLRRLPGQVVGMGVRPEHVQSPELRAPAGAD